MQGMEYHMGEVIPSHFDAAIVTGSYIASLCGCYLTVELLHRRGTGLKTWKSWFDTVVCATALGLVGVWCMHFIGNRAIILGNGEADIQLVYDPGYSVLSVFLPVIGLSIAFAVAEVRLRSPIRHYIALACTGIFAGLSIVGMHYMGNFGIKNYDLGYRPRFFWASIVIAIGDCLIVLFLFYTWRDKWINDARKRFLCALALAGGVSAMHFTASTRCIYKMRSWSSAAARRSRNIQVIMAGALCGGAVLVSFGILVIFHLRNTRRQRSAKKVMVSCAIFDSNDRILVTTEGVLPSRQITDKFFSRTATEEFDKSHPVFQWIFRVTHNWECISDFIPSMRGHLSIYGASGDIWSNAFEAGRNLELQTYSDYSVLLRERFCISAASLASSMHLSVENIGVLYDNIVDTGTLFSDVPARPSSSLRIYKYDDDLELGCTVDSLGKGQLIFLTRRVNPDEADKLLNAGFKFGHVFQVGRKIAQNMQVSFASLEAHITALKRYNDNLLNPQKRGTYIGCFALVPKAHSKGFEVVVKKNDQAQLPDIQLLPHDPTDWQTDFLKGMHGKTTHQCITYLKARHESGSNRNLREQSFAAIVCGTITTLYDQLPSDWLQLARFYGKPVHPHYPHPLRQSAPVVTLYAFVLCADLHTPINAFVRLARTPLSFLRIRHQCYSGSPHFAHLEREVHKEFGPLLARRATKSSDKLKVISGILPNGHSARGDQTIRESRRSSRADSDEKSDNDSVFSDEPSKSKSTSKRTYRKTSPPKTPSSNALGGILVNNKTVIESDQKITDGSDHSTVDLGLGFRVEVGTENAEGEKTFIDELCAFTRTTISSKGLL